MKKKDFFNSDTITAIATPSGEGAIGIIRISGELTLHIIKNLFKSRKHVKAFKSHSLYYGDINDTSGKTIDNVMLAYMKSPKTYTGENMAEIYTHGSSGVMQAVLKQVIQAGARPAQKGEFTRRAFLNGKMDLLQAEAVLDLIKSDTEASRQQAMSHLKGLLSEYILGIKEKLLQVKSHLEVMIDFPEEDVKPKGVLELGIILQAAHDETAYILNSYEHAKIIKEGIKVAFIGKPNVGKSSIFNAMLGESRAIVTEHPGTTRDYIQESINYQGKKIVLIDTAGLRKSEELVEKLGIEMTKTLIKQADINAIVIDPLKKVSLEEELLVIQGIDMQKVIVLINKIDVCKDIEEIKRIRTLFSPYQVFTISAKTKQGLDELERAISLYQTKSDIEGNLVISRERHKQAMEHTELALRNAIELLAQQAFPEIIAEEVDSAIMAISELTGEITPEDILDKIFSEFCIGK
ncbi:MAG: tRNA uridine-5-carboxymethylaminomethyl(34) synthesis GTPase MnmE [Deltaproteobacteria bacterium]|nr:tRNA uridine-5-carboxymethylaminomethyl(34) synthesis GTPase MnmE [Deltaproteobacteria bacterium]MCL5793076.1 tRNA uridine-5-carboxymethylaminomethyl(34) synthesis GTPase MnmE [Deltaproteobacteria bacterium]